MRWRPAAAAAAGVVAALGLHAGKAAADPVDESPQETYPQETTTTTAAAPVMSNKDRARLDEAAAALAASESVPLKGPVRPSPKVIHFQETVESPPPPVASQAAVPARPPVSGPLELRTGSVIRRSAPYDRTSPGTRAGQVGPSGSTAAAELPLTAAPVDAPVGSAPSADPMSAAVASLVLKVQPSPKATPPPNVDGVAASDASYAVWATDVADQRIAEKWRNSPVRGPPPTVATALGNSSTNTVTQVAVVRGRFGTEAVVTMQVQSSNLSNSGTATAEAHGSGSATATGNTADTSVIQVSVIVVRGTGNATIEQTADVDNVGVASATAGAADATAVGNDSSTSVTQVAVVYVEGSGDAHVTQTTAVDNVGIASADAAERSAVAVGNTSTTNVTQVSVVHVGNEDVAVNQTSKHSNIGVASASGGTASGNTATNTTVQVAKVSR